MDRRGLRSSSSSTNMEIILILRTIAMDHLHLVLTIIRIIHLIIICIITIIHSIQDIHFIQTIDIIPIEIDIIMINMKEEEEDHRHHRVVVVVIVAEWLDIVIKEEEEEEVEAVEGEAEVLHNEIEIIGEK